MRLLSRPPTARPAPHEPGTPRVRALRRRGPLALLFAGLLALVAACHPEFGPGPHGAPATSGFQGTITGVRVGHHPTFDRVVFDISGPVPGYTVEYQPAGVTGPSGIPTPVEGAFDLEVRFDPAVAMAFRATTPVATPRFDELREVKFVASFEGVVQFAVGVTERNDFRVFTLGNRVVLDILH